MPQLALLIKLLQLAVKDRTLIPVLAPALESLEFEVDAVAVGSR